MQWTSDPPTEAGWYWVRRSRDGVTKTVIVHIACAYGKTYAAFTGTDSIENLDNLGGCEWQGPILPEG